MHGATEVLETGKKELPLKRSQATPADKRDHTAKACKHMAHGGWCDKKHQRCPLFNSIFINQ